MNSVQRMVKILRGKLSAREMLSLLDIIDHEAPAGEFYQELAKTCNKITQVVLSEDKTKLEIFEKA